MQVLLNLNSHSFSATNGHTDYIFNITHAKKNKIKMMLYQNQLWKH